MARGIGDTLRASRREQRLTLAQAASEIRVREPYLAALEDEKFGALGGDVYVRAFLRGYSEYLGLDADQMVDAYRREYERDDGAQPPAATSARAATAVRPATAHRDAPRDGDDPPVAVPAQDDVQGQPPRRAVILAGVVLMLIGIVAAAAFVVRPFSGGSAATTTALAESPAPDPATPAPAAADAGAGAGAAQQPAPAPSPPEQPSPAPAAQPSPAPQEEPAVATQPEPEPTTPASPATGPLTALDVQVALPEAESWMRVTVDGVERLEGLQPAGYTETFRGTESVELRIGDASRVRITLNGVDQGQLGPPTWVAEVAYRLGEAPSVTTEAP